MLPHLALAVVVLAQASVYAQPAAAPQPPCAVQPINGQWLVTAQFIAGLNSVSGSAFSPEQQQAWNNFSKISASDWQNLQKRYLARIDAWRGRALPNAGPQQVAFYPFGGPDAANLLAFFPDAKTFVIVGLEPV